ncbi:hypothetical protein [Pseudonocardia acaciae]|uniref:hypothetical protein n=1 Tax=Pseudonocardia acaciae TaxID=551276 RepID=UPI0012EE6E88|nr:hypothetical protein [Pseudonocardia acaciae]
METQLVVLCSHQARVDQVSERIGRVQGARGLVVQVDQDKIVPNLKLGTSHEEFLKASRGRASDLSLKRNVGLLLARMLRWEKVVFIDDDITVSRGAVSRVAAQLDYYGVAGMICRDFPDNSVVCHARRLAGLPQDNFVTGAVLGVNCSETSQPRFFPDIYNEDWFFFAEAAARRRLANVGCASQADYHPFARPQRAQHEEFGDLLAEGLYALIGAIGLDGHKETFDDILCRAVAKYWKGFIEARQEGFDETTEYLGKYRDLRTCSDDVEPAMTSVRAAGELYDIPENNVDVRIQADLCASFVDELRGDRKRWHDYYHASPRHERIQVQDAMSWLGVARWTSVRSPLVDHG